MSRNTQAVRVLALLIKMCGFRRTGLTIEELCDQAEVSRRTLYRDFDAFKEVGIELETVRIAGAMRVRLKRIPGLIDD